jgi:hypothetical protein
MSQHVEFEPNTYYAAFSAELESSAYPMWALLSHLSDPSTVELTRRVLDTCQIALQDWLDAIHFTNPLMVRNNMSFLFNRARLIIRHTKLKMVESELRYTAITVAEPPACYMIRDVLLLDREEGRSHVPFKHQLTFRRQLDVMS